jgi:hypothetical protein
MSAGLARTPSVSDPRRVQPLCDESAGDVWQQCSTRSRRRSRSAFFLQIDRPFLLARRVCAYRGVGRVRCGSIQGTDSGSGPGGCRDSATDRPAEVFPDAAQRFTRSGLLRLELASSIGRVGAAVAEVPSRPNVLTGDLRRRHTGAVRSHCVLSGHLRLGDQRWLRGEAQPGQTPGGVRAIR